MESRDSRSETRPARCGLNEIFSVTRFPEKGHVLPVVLTTASDSLVPSLSQRMAFAQWRLGCENIPKTTRQEIV